MYIYICITNKMFSKRFERSAVLPTNAADRFVSRVVRGSHVLNQMFHLVELSEAGGALIPSKIPRMSLYHT